MSGLEHKLGEIRTSFNPGLLLPRHSFQLCGNEMQTDRHEITETSVLNPVASGETVGLSQGSSCRSGANGINGYIGSSGLHALAPVATGVQSPLCTSESVLRLPCASSGLVSDSVSPLARLCPSPQKCPSGDFRPHSPIFHGCLDGLGNPFQGSHSPGNVVRGGAQIPYK